jgi:serine/threonine-protein kinase
MTRTLAALAFGALIMPGLALAQSSDAPAPADTTPAPSADCTTLDCNNARQQQDNLNNNSGTPGAQDSPGDDQGTTGGSGTLSPTTPNDSLSGDDNSGGLGGGDNGGLSGSGGSSSGGLSN